MTAAQVAKLVKVDIRTIGRWCRLGHIPEEAVTRTPGGHYRIARWAIERHILKGVNS
ncbi:MAG: helix-turn-helix domain-containing protein [Fuerstiella sp.]|nr:helix-turn-helix domain-containing protein [Fuerstiella sp.]